MEKIDQTIISEMNVWKGEEAIKKYGAKGKNGVIEIITKKKLMFIFYKIDQQSYCLLK